MSLASTCAPIVGGQASVRLSTRMRLAHLREVGFSDATLWVLEHNLRARNWYERLGWRPTGERKAVYAPAQIDDLRYRFSLRP